MEKIIELERRVYELSIDDRNEILKWLAEAYYYNNELKEHGVFDELYIMLSSKYKPLTEDPKALELVKEVGKGDKEPSMNTMSLIVLEQIMIGLKGGLGLDTEHGIDKMLFDYHFKYNRDFINQIYMNQLHNKIGDKVYVVGKHERVPLLETGTLDDVEDYKSVKVNGTDYNFLGYKHYIRSISDENKNVLYYNGSDYDPALLIEPGEIQGAKTRLFGTRVASQGRK